MRSRPLDATALHESLHLLAYDRVLSADVAKLFFAEVYDLSRLEGWTSDEHFTADGTLIESLAKRGVTLWPARTTYSGWRDWN